jgi:hypothetical protein
VLASLYGDLQGSLRSRTLGDGLRRYLQRIAFIDPTFRLVQASFSTHLVEGPDFLRGPGEDAVSIWILFFGHGD